MDVAVLRCFYINTGEAGDLKRHCAHYDVIVMNRTGLTELSNKMAR